MTDFEQRLFAEQAEFAQAQARIAELETRLSIALGWLGGEKPERICLNCGAGEPCDKSEMNACTFDYTYPQLIALCHQEEDKRREAEAERDCLQAYQFETWHNLSETMAILRLENAPAEAWGTIQASLKALLGANEAARQRADTAEKWRDAAGAECRRVQAIDCRLRLELKQTQEALQQAILRADSAGAYVEDLKRLYGVADHLETMG